MHINNKEEYLKARSLALKEKKELESRGLSPFPAVLDEVFPEFVHANAVALPMQEIPAEHIVGTVSAGRISAFSASFLPLPEVESEFAMKWVSLLGAHLSDTGIREPIECYEYLGEFYVLEGNKRVSVLRYFGAPRIPAKIKRVLPAPTDDERVIAYYEFLDFHKATGIYDLLFRKSGGYARLLSAMGKRADSEWSESEKKRLSGTFYYFKEAFNALGKKEPGLYPEDALLLFLKVYSYAQLCEMSASEIKKALLALWGDVKSTAEPEAVIVRTAPSGDEKKA
ncbi:MAG: hypothetical protein IKI64_04525 [Clostridia bacterium]|nr:hypothetical protein [Clostridia bacterium]